MIRVCSVELQRPRGLVVVILGSIMGDPGWYKKVVSGSKYSDCHGWV